jgi:hypothetical protein
MTERNATSAFAMQGSLNLDDFDDDALNDMDILGDVEAESVDDGTPPDSFERIYPAGGLQESLMNPNFFNHLDSN